jgi:hypothetical protein
VKDITCRLGGTRQIDRAATAIYNTLIISGGPVGVHAIDLAVIGNGSHLFWKSAACKALRNLGLPVIVDVRRHLTTYAFDPAATDEQAWQERTMTDIYSRLVSMTRGLHGNSTMADPMKVGVHQSLQMATINVGLFIGLPLMDIAADMVPVP